MAVTILQNISTSTYIPASGEKVVDLDKGMLTVGDGVTRANALPSYSGIEAPPNDGVPRCRFMGEWKAYQIIQAE